METFQITWRYTKNETSFNLTQRMAKLEYFWKAYIFSKEKLDFNLPVSWSEMAWFMFVVEKNIGNSTFYWRDSYRCRNSLYKPNQDFTRWDFKASFRGANLVRHQRGEAWVYQPRLLEVSWISFAWIPKPGFEWMDMVISPTISHVEIWNHHHPTDSQPF